MTPQTKILIWQSFLNKRNDTNVLVFIKLSVVITDQLGISPELEVAVGDTGIVSSYHTGVYSLSNVIWRQYVQQSCVISLAMCSSNQ
jgi:hypothetical protein